MTAIEEGMMTERRFEGRVAFVSGGASGIGLAIARQLVAAGAIVRIADLTDAQAAAAALGGSARGYRLDVADEAAVQTVFADIADTIGSVTLAANCAGIGGTGRTIVDDDLAGWRAVQAVNVEGVVNCLRPELRQMRAAGGGAIVNVASVMALHGTPGNAAYSASKHAVVGLTKSAALENAAAGIRVNALCPGFVDTPLLRGAADDARLAAIAARHPIGRLAQPDEIAAFACFLLSDAASFVTGSVHLVDGGYSAQ